MKSKREIPDEYGTEIQALELCCQHRSHCFVYDIVGFLQVCMSIFCIKIIIIFRKVIQRSNQIRAVIDKKTMKRSDLMERMFDNKLLLYWSNFDESKSNK